MGHSMDWIWIKICTAWQRSSAYVYQNDFFKEPDRFFTGIYWNFCHPESVIQFDKTNIESHFTAEMKIRSICLITSRNR